MKKLFAAAIAALFLVTGAGVAQAESSVQVGVLTCDVEPGVGYLIGSSKAVECKFTRKGHKTETYSGSIDKIGLDIGVTGGGKIAWLVFAATKNVPKRALAGNYVGASAEASVIVGVGGNWLVGGSKKSIALQPWSVTGTIGLNWSWTFTKLSLD